MHRCRSSRAKDGLALMHRCRSSRAKDGLALMHPCRYSRAKDGLALMHPCRSLVCEGMCMGPSRVSMPKLPCKVEA